MTLQTREIIEFKLQPALAECALHRQRLHQAWKEACEFGVLKQTSPPPLNDEEVRTLDQLVFRFGRLQDAIGTRLLPAMLQLTQEWRDNEPFIDKLNRAEKLGMLPSAEQWQLLRELRNQSALPALFPALSQKAKESFRKPSVAGLIGPSTHPK